jgi:uncharacterized protein YkwD
MGRRVSGPRPLDEEKMMRRYRLLVLLCAASACLLTGGATGQNGDPPIDLTPAEKKFFEMTNQERVKNHLPPLKLNPVLCKVARAHSENMAKQGKMEHTLDGKNQFARIKGAGYRYRYAGENIARTNKEGNMDDALESLMKSGPHRANILKKEYTEVGIGLAYDGKDFTYYTQDFAMPKKAAK